MARKIDEQSDGAAASQEEQSVGAGQTEQDQPVDDPTIIRTTQPIEPIVAEAPVESVRSTAGIRAERARFLREHYGGFFWGSDLMGFAVATFFTILFLGVVGAVVGAVGYQMGTAVPKIGGAVSNTTQSLGIGALVGSLIALFLAYYLGGYTAGRMARYDGAKNGFGVVIWTIIAAIVLGIAGGALGTRFNVANQVHLNINTQTLTTAGVVSLAVTLLVIIVAAVLGGKIGERYHRAVDREAGVTQ